MTSFIAAGGSGRCTRVMPAVPAASSVTTIAFIRALPQADPVIPLPTADRDPPARLVIAIGDFHTAESFAAPSVAAPARASAPYLCRVSASSAGARVVGVTAGDGGGAWARLVVRVLC